MKLSRHPLDEETYWRRREQSGARLLATIEKQSNLDLLGRMHTELELGLICGYLANGLYEESSEHLIKTIDSGCALALARVCAQRSSAFTIELRRDDRVLRLPARHNGFCWPHWLLAFSLALLSRDQQALSVLGTAECVDACALPLDRIDRFWPLLCGAFAALYQADPAVEGLLDDAQINLDRVQVIGTELRDAVYQPLVSVARALAAGDADAVATAALGALEARKGYFASQTDGARDPNALFDLPLSALIDQAGRRGLGPLPESDYLLAPFHRSDPKSEIVCVYPRLGILSAVEADWLMQNEGFAEHDPSKLYQDEDGRLVAHYRARGAPGVPLAELDFELLDADKDSLFDGTHAPPALDVGELLYRAECLASEQMRDSSGKVQYDLRQAVEAVDLALQYIAAMPGGFSPDSLHSEVGKRLYEQEPGRFRYERLLVYRNALARQGGLAEKTARESPLTGVDSREQAIALLEELQMLVAPLLQEIALDTSGEVYRRLVPADADYGRAFVGEAVEAARKHYPGWWRNNPTPVSIDPTHQIDVHLAPAGMLADDNELSYHFPRGYRAIAPWLSPHRVWVCWKYHPPGQTGGISMNGLVWLDDHWAWFPKPYQLLAQLQRH